MRYIPRDSIDIPNSLSGEKSKGRTETEKAIRHYSGWENKGKLKSYKFTCYKSEDVVEALMKLFHNKCAYCEHELAGQPPDIEHWRPKAAFFDESENKLESPGYYWLAADWENLLPSCIDCNRRRNYRFPQLKGKTKRGKENLFPLKKDSKRARNPKDKLDEEKPLLLNPCEDNPEEYLDFNESKGHAICVRADITEDMKERADRSISVYGLDRPVLTKAREKALLPVKMLMENIDELREEINMTNDPDTKARLIRKAIKDIVNLEELATPDKEYSFMVQKQIERFKLRLV